MNKGNHFNFEEVKVDLDKMEFHKIEDNQLSKEEIANNIKNNEEKFKNEKLGLSFDFYIGPSIFNIKSYYLFWRIQLLYSIDSQVLNRLIENGFNENVILDELGITKEEFYKPDQGVIAKVKKYISESKGSISR